MKRFLFLLLYFLLIDATAQVLKNSAVFSLATPYIEPDGRKLTAKIGASNFVALSKIKGHLHGESSYQLEGYDKELTNRFKVVLICPHEEDYKELFYNGEELYLFSVIHDEHNKKATLKAYVFNPETGEKKEDILIDERSINDFEDAPGKGAVKSTFESIVCFSLAKHFSTHFQYQYQIQYAPDKKKLLIYIYDYSQKHLTADAIILDDKLKQLAKSTLSIDNGFINHGIYLNNKGELFILNTERTGRIVVIYFNPVTKANKLLDIQNASTNRTSLTMQVVTDLEIYIACINVADGKLAGVMYAKFDFKTNAIEKINFHDISVGIQQTVDVFRSSNKNLTGVENWFNYEIVNFHVNEFEKVVIVLEKREIIGTDYSFNPLMVNHTKNMVEKILKVNTEGILLFSFNKDEELLWENFYLKSQVNDITLGIVASSYSFTIADNGYLRFLYPSAESSSGVYNAIHYIEFDELTGNKTKDLKVTNDDGISMIKDYTLWWEDQIVTVGRKGLLGKKSFIYRYILESNP